MRLKIRKSSERGHANHGWLKTFHTFSFDTYQDLNHMGFRSLRVINEDWVTAGEGFPTHAHRDMEIITYVISGTLEHKDSMGNGSQIPAGMIQYMSAGSGVTHSEYNPSSRDFVHLLQIWIRPNEKGLSPRYDQREILNEEKTGKLKLLVSPDGRQNSIAIRQDAFVYASILEPGTTLNHPILNSRGLWIQVVHGELQFNQVSLSAGDGASLEEEALAVIKAGTPNTEFLLFDLA